MKYLVYLNGQSFQTSSALPKTHVLIGQRNMSGHDPMHALDMEAKADWNTRFSSGNLTADEQEAWNLFVTRKVGGYFALGVLEWAGSAEAAEALKEQFPAPEWINTEVRTVDRVIGRG